MRTHLEHDQEVGYFIQPSIFPNNFNEIKISDLSGAFTNSSIQYNHPGYNLFIDDKNVITNDMDQNDKVVMVLHRDYHRRKLYVNL